MPSSDPRNRVHTLDRYIIIIVRAIDCANVHSIMLSEKSFYVEHYSSRVKNGRSDVAKIPPTRNYYKSNWMFFLAPSLACFLFIFRLFEKCIFKIWRCDSNPPPLEQESFPVTTRQVLKLNAWYTYFCQCNRIWIISANKNHVQSWQ